MDTPETQSPSPPPRPRWYRLTPDRLVLALLPWEGLLFLWQRWRVIPIPAPKGYPVLTAVASVAGVLVILLLWFLACLLFRRRFQFTLRSMLIFTTAVALMCSWFAVEIRAAKKQERIVQAILHVSGWVRYDDHVELGMERFTSTLRKPPAMERLLGRDFFGKVTVVALVNLFDSPPQDVVPENELLISVAQLPKEPLRSLDLLHLDLRAASLDHFQQFANLEGIALGRNADTSWLGAMTHLRRLRLLGGESVDQSLQPLEGLPLLESVDLSAADVTDAGLTHLERLPSLRNLNLDFTDITNVGLERLKRFSSLKDVSLKGTLVTAEDVESLRKASPQLKIWWEDTSKPAIFQWFWPRTKKRSFTPGSP